MSMTFENAATKSVDVNGANFVFREIGKKGGVPVVLLHHLTAVLEDWDPRVVDGLARISHGFKRIGAPNQRKLFCENDFLVIRGEPRCRQSVPRIFLDLKPSKAAR